MIERILRKMTISTRLQVIVIGLIIVLVATLSVVAVQSTNKIADQAEKHELSQYHDAFQNTVDMHLMTAKLSALQTAKRPDVQRVFAQRDRQKLLEIMEPTYKALKPFGVAFLPFHKPNLDVFLRTHKPERYGDNSRALRETTTKVNEEQVVIGGVERSRLGLAARTIVPISHQSQHIGSVEYGFSLDRVALNFAKRFDVDVQLFEINSDGEYALSAESRPMSYEFNWPQIREHLNGEQRWIREHQEGEGEHLAVEVRKIRDYQGDPVGAIAIYADRSFYEQVIGNAYQAIGWGSGLLLAVAIGLLMAISRSILNPTCEITRQIRTLGTGEDAGARLSEQGRDEFTELAAVVNKLLDTKQARMDSVRQASDQVTATAEQLKGLADQTSASVDQQRSQTEQVATAMNEMSVATQEVAKNAQEGATSTEGAFSMASEGQSQAEKVERYVRSLAREADESASSVDALNNEVQRIHEIMNVIHGIAEQTSLLSLNAAIEAARAGEAGRGFAVVADEVQKLAQQTQDSTQEIRQITESISSSTQGVVQRIYGQKESVDAIEEQVQHITTVLNNIYHASEQARAMSEQIASAAEEQSQTASEVDQNVTQINEHTGSLQRNAEALQEQGEELNRSAQALQGTF